LEWKPHDDYEIARELLKFRTDWTLSPIQSLYIFAL
jgi:hypothetical protein